MKKLSLTFMILVSLLISCENGSSAQEKTIFGSWKLVETYGSSTGTSISWRPVENGYTFNFDENNDFTSNKYIECQKGTFIISNNELILTFDCDNFTAGIETPPGTFIEKFSLDGDILILSPAYLNCDEGCDYKFKRISSN